LKILRGEIEKPEDVGAWLDHQRTDIKVDESSHPQ